MPTITESICTGNSRYKAAEIFQPKGVVLHSIGTPQPSADVLRTYWQNNGSAYVVHYMVDDTKILHCMPDNYKCWHVGSPANNYYLGIEMGEPKQIKYTSGAKFTVSDLAAAQEYTEKCYKNAVWLIAHLCKKYGWNPATALYTHNEITKKGLSNTDHVDPEHLWNGLGMGYDLAKLRKDVAAAMSGSAANTTTPETANKLYRVRKSWDDPKSQIGAYKILANAKNACKDGYSIFDENGNKVYTAGGRIVEVTADVLNVRSGAGIYNNVVMQIKRGERYTIVDERDGWGKLKSGAGWISLKYVKDV